MYSDINATVYPLFKTAKIRIIHVRIPAGIPQEKLFNVDNQLILLLLHMLPHIIRRLTLNFNVGHLGQSCGSTYLCLWFEQD